MADARTALDLFNMIISQNSAHALSAAVAAFDFEAAAADSGYASWNALRDSARAVSIEQGRLAAAAAVAQAQAQVARQPVDAIQFVDQLEFQNVTLERAVLHVRSHLFVLRESAATNHSQFLKCPMREDGCRAVYRIIPTKDNPECRVARSLCRRHSQGRPRHASDAESWRASVL